MHSSTKISCAQPNRQVWGERDRLRYFSNSNWVWKLQVWIGAGIAFAMKYLQTQTCHSFGFHRIDEYSAEIANGFHASVKNWKSPMSRVVKKNWWKKAKLETDKKKPGFFRPVKLRSIFSSEEICEEKTFFFLPIDLEKNALVFFV